MDLLATEIFLKPALAQPLKRHTFQNLELDDKGYIVAAKCSRHASPPLCAWAIQYNQALNVMFLHSKFLSPCLTYWLPLVELGKLTLECHHVTCSAFWDYYKGKIEGCCFQWQPHVPKCLLAPEQRESFREDMVFWYSVLCPVVYPHMANKVNFHDTEANCPDCIFSVPLMWQQPQFKTAGSCLAWWETDAVFNYVHCFSLFPHSFQ